MMADPITIAVLGWFAGSINLCSSIPQLIANFKDASLAASQSPLRNALQALGNMLWLIYGLQIEAQEMIVFASFGSLMAIALLIQVIHAR